ncbi:dihydroorotate dehydrogenase electron transfer subunit [Rhizobiaceae sp. 2RAB30]
MPASRCAVPDSVPLLHSIHEAECEVKSHAPVNGEYRLLVLDAPPSLLDCEPGQFFHLHCPRSSRHLPYLRRPMSIYGFDRAKSELTFLYKVAGAGTAALTELKQGAPLNVVGPLGRGFELRPDWRRPLLLARGVGLATLAPLASEFARHGLQFTAICSARSPELLMSVDLFRSYGGEVVTVTDVENNSDAGSVSALVERLIATRRIDSFFTCGSSRLLRMLQGLGIRHGIGGQVAVEQHMACGIGMCQACVRPFRREGATINLRVCREGPVFDLAEVL